MVEVAPVQKTPTKIILRYGRCAFYTATGLVPTAGLHGYACAWPLFDKKHRSPTREDSEECQMYPEVPLQNLRVTVCIPIDSPSYSAHNHGESHLLRITGKLSLDFRSSRDGSTRHDHNPSIAIKARLGAATLISTAGYTFSSAACCPSRQKRFMGICTYSSSSGYDFSAVLQVPCAICLDPLAGRNSAGRPDASPSRTASPLPVAMSVAVVAPRKGSQKRI